MTVRLNPYISFRDTAEQAMTFYQSVFGGELTMMKFADMSMPGLEPDEANKIMHSQIDVEGVLTLMAADTPNSMDVASGNHSISLSGDDEETLRGWWDGLVDGGTITMPIEKAPWGDTFGQLTDRFGINWLVNISGSPEAGPPA